MTDPQAQGERWEGWTFFENAEGSTTIMQENLGIAFWIDEEIQEFDVEGFVEMLNMWSVGHWPRLASADAPTVAPDISADGVKWTCFLCHAENISGHICKECHRPGRAVAPDVQAGEWKHRHVKGSCRYEPELGWACIYSDEEREIWRLTAALTTANIANTMYKQTTDEMLAEVDSLTTALREAQEKTRLLTNRVETVEALLQSAEDRNRELLRQYETDKRLIREAQERAARLTQAVQCYKDLNDRWNNSDWHNEQEYNAQYREIARAMYAALTEQPAGD